MLAPVIAAIIGTTLGVTAGYFGGWIDRIIGRIIDLLLAFPELLLGILIAAALGGGFWNIVVVLTVAFAPRLRPRRARLDAGGPAGALRRGGDRRRHARRR